MSTVPTGIHPEHSYNAQIFCTCLLSQLKPHQTHSNSIWIGEQQASGDITRLKGCAIKQVANDASDTRRAAGASDDPAALGIG